jgi:hypothetical protein
MLAVADTLALAAVAVALCDEGPARRHCPAHCPLGYLACFVSNITRALLLHGGSVDAAVADVTSRWAWHGIAAKTRSVHPALFKARSVVLAPGAAVLGDCARRSSAKRDLLGIAIPPLPHSPLNSCRQSGFD